MITWDDLEARRAARDRTAAIAREAPPAEAAAEAAAAAAAASAYAEALAALPGQLDPAVPCLLLPVRLETRFGTAPGGGAQLRVRIYPDEIHLDTHERALTDGEIRLGTAYWHALWELAAEPAPTDGTPDPRPARRVAVWEQLTRRIGPARGALVAATLTPTTAPPSPPEFPTVSTLTAPWTRPAWAEALPERWVVRAWRDNALVAEANGELIPRPLPAGPGPQGIDADAAWMTDFDRAVAAGMAVIMDIGTPRVDVLTVVGVRGTDTPAAGAAALANLLHAHHFTAGLDLMPRGTPTNNTSDRRTGVDAHAGPAEHSYSAERAGLDVPLAAARTPIAATDAARVSAALGLPAVAAGARPADVLPGTGGPVPDPMATVAHGSDRGVADARDMAAVLWPATWGYFGAQMVEEDALLRSGRSWILDTVAAGGPLPTLRVGPQPYGLLPATPLAAWRPWPDPPDLAILRTTTGGSAELRVGYDLGPGDDVRGSWVAAVPPPGTAGVWALTAADLAGPALVALAVVPANDARLAVSTGAARGLSWGTVAAVPAGHPTLPTARLTGGGAVAVAALPGDVGPCVVVVLEHGDPGTGRRAASIRVGVGLATDRVARWSRTLPLPAVEDGAALLGACVATPEGDTWPALALLHAIGHRLTLRVGHGLLSRGSVAEWTDPVDVPVPTGVTLRTASVTSPVSDRALLVHWTGERGGHPVSEYVVAPRLTRRGAAAPRWSGPVPVPGGRPSADTVATAVAVLDAGPDPTPGLGTPGGRVALLAALRAGWRAPLDADRVPRVYPKAARNSADTLLDLLSTDAVSSSVQARGAIGPVLAGNLWKLLNLERKPSEQVGTGYEARLEAAVQQDMHEGQLILGSRLTRIGFESFAEPFTDPLVAASIAEQDPLPDPGNYLAWAADAPPPELHAGRGGRGGTEGALLERLVRHATLQAWADAAFDIRPPDRVDLPLREPELIDVADLTARDPITPPYTLTSWRHLSQATFSADHPRFPGRPVLAVLVDLVAAAEAASGVPDPAVADVVAHRAALRRLARLPVGTLEILTMGTLDVPTHRLDAWVTAVATDRLHRLRAARPAGLHLGGFGMALDLTARTAPLSEGYTLAPSLGHAATVAVARSGYLAHADDPDGGRLDLQLTSRRVRRGLDLLDGLRTGQPMSALLGQRFERELHDLPGDLDRYLSSLRALAPATAGKRVAVPSAGAGAAEARGPLDGLALLRNYHAGVIPWGTTPAGEIVALPGPDPADPDRSAIIGLLADLADQVDAVGDLAIAEAVHQTVLGNPVRAGALLNAVNRGEPVHADPEVVRTPRSGIAVTHRVLVLLPADAPSGGWSSGAATTPRVAADPAAEAWAAGLLGAPGRIRWRAVFPAAEGGLGETVTADHTLAAVGLGALDVVALAVAADVQPYGRLTRSPSLDSLLLTHAADRPPPDAAADAIPELELDRAPDWPADDLGIPELLELARRIGLLVGGARPAGPADLAEPGHDPGAPDDPTLTTRAAAAAAQIGSALTALRDAFPLDSTARAALVNAVRGLDAQALTCALDLPSPLDLGALDALAGLPTNPAAARAALRALALHGVPGAAAESAAGAGPEATASLRRQAHRISRVGAGRVDAAAAATSPADVVRAALGEDAIALPRFAAADPAALRIALTTREAAGDAGSATVADWLAEAAGVRAGVARLRGLRLVASSCGRDALVQPRVAQLPPPAPGGTDRWAALPLPEVDPPATQPAGVVGIVLTGAPLDPLRAGEADVLAGPLAGLLVDEWVEVIPSRTTTGAVTFHLDAPGASPPQSLLLAVSPDPRAPWSTDLLESTVLDTLRLAQERMIDPDLAPILGHLLPALLLARNDGDGGLGDTIATAFRAP